jgi:hypothetical protein
VTTRGISSGRKSSLSCGSERGGERAAVMYSLIVTARNDGDPQAWLADVLARIAEHRPNPANCCRENQAARAEDNTRVVFAGFQLPTSRT